MANYFSYPEGIENNIEWKINNKNAIYYVSECSKNGGILPKGIQIFRSCKSLKEDNDRLLWNAMEQVKFILDLKENVADFVIYCNRLASPSEEEQLFVINEKKEVYGICFTLSGVESYDTKFAIELPHLYALVNKTDDDNVNCICFYGDKPKLENCAHVVMHICGNGTLKDKAKLVFLTPIPDEWYIDKL